MLFLALRAGGQRLVLPTGQWGRLWLLALLNITSWNMLVAFGVGMIPSGRAAILAYTMPVWAVPLSVWLLGERITRRKLLGLALGMGGLALLLGEAFVSLGAAPLGSLLVLGAALSWALGTVLQKRYPGEHAGRAVYRVDHAARRRADLHRRAAVRGLARAARTSA